MSNNKWILIISPQIYPCQIGGIEIFNYHFIDEFKRYYPIHVWTPCQGFSLDGITVHHYEKRKFTRVTLPLQLFLFVLRNRKHIRTLYFGYSRSYWTYWMVFILLKNIFKVHYGFTMHGGGLSTTRPKFPFFVLGKKADFITGVSQRIVSENQQRLQKEIVYTPPLLPFDVIATKDKYRMKWGISPEEKVLLYVGSIKPLKAVDTLIEALGVLSLSIFVKYKLKVLIAGDGPSRKALEHRVRELNLNESVIFLGAVKRRDVSQLYNLADLYTICSEFEGLPISLLEAFANKLPCITSDAPGLIDMSNNQQNTITFTTRDHIDYAHKLKELLENKKLQYVLKNNVYRYYQDNFSYTKLLEIFKDIINNIDENE